ARRAAQSARRSRCLGRAPRLSQHFRRSACGRRLCAGPGPDPPQTDPPQWGDGMKDFRRRNLIVLGSCALLSVALAAAVLTVRARETAARFTPGEFLPGFATKVKDATRIHIVSHDSTFDFTYSQAKGRDLPARGNYP